MRVSLLQSLRQVQMDLLASIETLKLDIKQEKVRRRRTILDRT
jgi:hypothetical protein